MFIILYNYFLFSLLSSWPYLKVGLQMNKGILQLQNLITQAIKHRRKKRKFKFYILNIKRNFIPLKLKKANLQRFFGVNRYCVQNEYKYRYIYKQNQYQNFFLSTSWWTSLSGGFLLSLFLHVQCMFSFCGLNAMACQPNTNNYFFVCGNWFAPVANVAHFQFKCKYYAIIWSITQIQTHYFPIPVVVMKNVV